MTAVSGEKGALLEVTSLSVRFGDFHALNDVSLRLHPHSRTAVIGPNGAGKSTLMGAIAGVTRPSGGDIAYAGASIAGAPAYKRAKLGISRTFQNLELFGTMSARDNLRVVAEAGKGISSAMVDEMLERFQLTSVADVVVGKLPYGTRKLVELTRAFLPRPRLLLLDEPAAGLDGTEKKAIAAVLREMLDVTETALLLVEHDMPTVESLCTQVHVLNAGSEISSGTFQQVTSDPRVVEAYLGA
jgi:branched-chain amino acid transport system ATP-binding protein